MQVMSPEVKLHDEVVTGLDDGFVVQAPKLINKSRAYLAILKGAKSDVA